MENLSEEQKKRAAEEVRKKDRALTIKLRQNQAEWEAGSGGGGQKAKAARAIRQDLSPDTNPEERKRVDDATIRHLSDKQSYAELSEKERADLEAANARQGKKR